MYLDVNKNYWSLGVYDAPNTETYVFRAYGRIFKFELGLDGSGKENLLDFGCGPGGNTKFYHQKGFTVYGVDLSEIDIKRCKERMPAVASNFKIVKPEPTQNDVFFPGVNFKIITAFQALYYYSHKDLETRLKSLYKQMDNGGIIYATMMHQSCWYWDMSEPFDDGLRLVKLNRVNDKNRPGLITSNHYINFVKDEEDLKKKFHMFKPLHIGYYDSVYRNDERSEKHLTFIGIKK
jgi:SAM-dependent methyltransferase